MNGYYLVPASGAPDETATEVLCYPCARNESLVTGFPIEWMYGDVINVDSVKRICYRCGKILRGSNES